MLQYLIILLDDTSTSYCHYDVPKCKRRLMPLDTLKRGIRFGMMENLMIQFVFPDYELPRKYHEVVETIDHSKIRPVPLISTIPDSPLKGEDPSGDHKDADVLVLNHWGMPTGDINMPLVLRTTKAELFTRYTELKNILMQTRRLNVIITDVETFTDEDIEEYQKVLAALSTKIEYLYVEGKSPQLNLLTDRMMLSQMNNCNAGNESITLAPNGKFYICPAFYYEDETDNVGDLEHGLDIKNKQLYKLEYAPICRHCDAWQCKRCVWLNRKATLEVNTPSHEQCVAAHLERNASRELLRNIRKHGSFLLEQGDIKEIDYLDPFDKRETWQ